MVLSLYDYMNRFDNFKESLPSKNKFYNSLTDDEISDKNDEHIANVWKIFDTEKHERLS